MKLSKCCKRLVGLKETTKPKDNLVELERVYKWNKCRTADTAVQKSDLDSRTQGYLCLFCWLLEVLLSEDGRTGSADSSWGNRCGQQHSGLRE